jgi:hypothetical protein
MERERKALERECNAMSEGRKSAGGWRLLNLVKITKHILIKI